MNFTTLNNGMCDGFVLIKRCEEKKTKNGASYLDLIIGDKDGEMPAKLWDFSGKEIFEEEMVVKIRGTVEQYNGKDQFRIAQIRPAAAGDDYNLSELVPSSEVGGQQIFNMLLKRAEAFKDPDFKAITTTILNEKKDLLINCPAAFKLHHAMIGGLMLHTMSIVRMAEEICRIYPNINKDLLLAGAILHDVAKTWEFSLGKTGLVKGYSTEGELIGHLVKGAMYVEEAGKKLNINREKTVLLEHMILSHHGNKDFGSPILPLTREAVVLHFVDDLDSKMNILDKAYDDVEEGEFTQRIIALDGRAFYKPKKNSF